MSYGDLSSEVGHYLQKLFPLCRSLTGEGNRETLRILQDIVPLEIIEYPSGKAVYDWTIPDEWNVKDAWIKDSEGRRVIDFGENNLHLVSYSEPVSRWMWWNELKEKIYCLDQLPQAIPYRTSYYKRDWGFCVTKAQYDELEAVEGELDVHIDSTIDPTGSMTIGELFIPGDQTEEYLLSTYLCHPSMANDNLSGLIVTTLLARELFNGKKPNRSWRILFLPETIGAIAYLHENQPRMENVIGGLVATCCGGSGPLGYKESYLGDHLVDRAIRLAFRDRGIDPVCYPFAPDGSDERQYSSPGFRIPVASITKDKYYEYEEYHTSLDNLEFVEAKNVVETYQIYREVVKVLDSNVQIESTMQYGEAQLGKRNLYPTLGGMINQNSIRNQNDNGIEKQVDAMSWLLFLGDGNTDTISVSERSKISYEVICKALEKLKTAGLIAI